MEEPYDVSTLEISKYELEEDLYGRKYIDDLLEDDELSFEEAAFMTGYCDFA